MAFFFSNNGFSSLSKKKNFFPKTTKEFKRLKTYLLSLFPEFSDSDVILFPYNDFISFVGQKEFWTQDEIKKLDEQFSHFLKRKVIKDFAQYI